MAACADASHSHSTSPCVSIALVVVVVGPRRPSSLTPCLYGPIDRQYFDVDTVDVQQRLTRALVPFKKNPSFAELIASSPDAYGPFWLSTTLVFCLASCSNVASFMDFTGASSEWAYDFSRLASAYTLVEAFLLGLPLLLWLLGKYLSVPMTLSFLVCLYGYSMAVFIPASVRLRSSGHGCCLCVCGRTN